MHINRLFLKQFNRLKIAQFNFPIHHFQAWRVQFIICHCIDICFLLYRKILKILLNRHLISWMFCSQNFFFFFRCHICIYLCCRYRCMPQHFFVYIEYLHPLPSNMLQMNVETYVVLYSYLLLSHAHIYVSYFWLIAQITYSPITHKKSATKCCPFYSGFFSIY